MPNFVISGPDLLRIGKAVRKTETEIEVNPLTKPALAVAYWVRADEDILSIEIGDCVIQTYGSSEFEDTNPPQPLEVYNPDETTIATDTIFLAVKEFQSGQWIAWVKPPTVEPLVRFELQEDMSAFAPGSAAAITLVGVTLDNGEEIRVYDPFGIFAEVVSGQRGYAQYFPDAEQYEVIQISCPPED